VNIKTNRIEVRNRNDRTTVTATITLVARVNCSSSEPSHLRGAEGTRGGSGGGEGGGGERKLDQGLDLPYLVNIVLHQLRIVELHVSVNRNISKELVVVVIRIITSLNHDKMLPLLILCFLVGPLGY